MSNDPPATRETPEIPPSPETGPGDLDHTVAECARRAVVAWSGRALGDWATGDEEEILSPTRPPRPELGDLAIPCFPLAKAFHRKPVEIAAALLPALEGELREAATAGRLPALARLATAGPYVNLTFDAGSLAEWICARITAGAPPYGAPLPATGRRTMVEYSAPNTNKPLHLGHVRNNLLGLSLCQILAAAGDEVIPVNLINDRGIHIAKSMVAYERWGAGTTPEQAGEKGDHFVGRFYVRFGTELKAATDALAREQGHDPEGLDEERRREIEEQTELMPAARQCLRRWEEGDAATLQLWERMNGWVYAGFDQTYARLGCTFRKWYFESGTFRRGKELVEEGLARGIFVRRDDGSVWADLEAEDLGQKILLRSDGTSVYITQDLGTAVLKYDDFQMNRSLYVVGSEQIHHFRLLFTLLRKLGFPWAAGCHHVSYGLVTLPRGMGKLKSREGRAVDADDMLDELAGMAQEKAREGGYATEAEGDLGALGDAIGQGALKMYLLQVGAEKNIQFDPDRTLDFEGDTGPAVQYSHARICSIVRKALATDRIEPGDLVTIDLPDPFAHLGTGSPVSRPPTAASDASGEAVPEGSASAPAADDRAEATDGGGAGGRMKDAAALVHRAAGLRGDRAAANLLDDPHEKGLCLELARFPAALGQAAAQLSAAPVAGFLLDLTKAYARFYHNCPVLRAQDDARMRARLHLSLAVAAVLRRGLALLGIQAPDAM
ncbi:MAG: arginine--tRNA ligase [Candidatus Eisenbacteria sp.]|nr:arginine--tRNA ligase [Candidatus Eisenbacteria bacterium]